MPLVLLMFNFPWELCFSSSHCQQNFQNSVKIRREIMIKVFKKYNQFLVLDRFDKICLDLSITEK